jgi:hypothetical protein
MCLYCQKPADKQSALYLRLMRENERREFWVARCRECAARQEHHMGAFGCVAFVFAVLTIGLLIAALIWITGLFIGVAATAVGLAVFVTLTVRAHRAEWREISPPVLALIGEGWRPR